MTQTLWQGVFVSVLARFWIYSLCLLKKISALAFILLRIYGLLYNQQILIAIGQLNLLHFRSLVQSSHGLASVASKYLQVSVKTACNYIFRILGDINCFAGGVGNKLSNNEKIID